MTKFNIIKSIFISSLLVSSSMIHAQNGGTIRFTGPIVMPTCGSVGPTTINTITNCNVTPETQLVSSYRQTITKLDKTSSIGDSLMEYFIDYAGTQNSRLIIRTYN